MIHQFFLRQHKLSDAAVNGLLKCISFLLPDGNHCPKTRAGLRIILEAESLFGRLKYSSVAFCNSCEVESSFCLCEDTKNEAHLIIFDLKNQFNKILKGKTLSNFFSLLMFRI